MGRKKDATKEREEEFKQKLKSEFIAFYQEGYRTQVIIDKIGKEYGMSNVRVQNLIKPRKTIRDYGIDD